MRRERKLENDVKEKEEKLVALLEDTCQFRIRPVIGIRFLISTPILVYSCKKALSRKDVRPINGIPDATMLDDVYKRHNTVCRQSKKKIIFQKK